MVKVLYQNFMKKICYVTSCGGHLTEVLEYSKKLEKYDHFFVINRKKDISFVKKKFYVVSHSTFDLKFFLVLYQAYKILKIEKPDLIISTGASLAVQFFILAKIFKINNLFIESLTRVNELSRTGKIVKLLTKNFFVQTITLKKKYNLKIIDPFI